MRRDGIISQSELESTKNNPFFNSGFPRVSSDEGLARLEYGLKTLRLFADAGVRIVAGSDIAIAMSRPGAALRELQLLSRAGLDNQSIIRCATVNQAERLGLPSGTGIFTPGAMADAVLLNSDPLASIDAMVRAENVGLVFKAGTVAAGE